MNVAVDADAEAEVAHRRGKKTKFQTWLKEIPFSHFITVEPTPSAPFSQNEIIQRMRTLEFQLNKKYLKSSFPKWNRDMRFWMMGFREGDGIGHQIHYHLFLYSPSEIHKNRQWKNIGSDIQMGWIMMPSKQRHDTQRMRKFCRNEKAPLDIQKISARNDGGFLRRPCLGVWFFGRRSPVHRLRQYDARGGADQEGWRAGAHGDLFETSIALCVPGKVWPSRQGQRQRQGGGVGWVCTAQLPDPDSPLCKFRRLERLA